MRPTNAHSLGYFVSNGILGLVGLALLGSAVLVARGKVTWIDRWRQGGADITPRTYVLLVGAAALLTIFASVVMLLTSPASRWQLVLVSCAVIPLVVVLVQLIRIFR